MALRIACRPAFAKVGSYLFNGQLLTTAGIYADSLLSSGGCDSVPDIKPSNQQFPYH